MKRQFFRLGMLGLLTLNMVATAADSLRRAPNSVQQSVVLFIQDDSQSVDKLNRIFAANFDQYDKSSKASTKDSKNLQRDIKRFVANKVNANTLVTVYYRGKAVSRADNSIDLLTENGASISVQHDIIRRVLSKKPLGLFVFLDADGISDQVVKPSWGGTAVFLPETSDNREHFADDFIDATQNNGMFVNIPALSQRLSRSAVLFDHLNYQRFADYCLFPTPRGCHIDKLPDSHTTVASQPGAEKTNTVTLANCPASIGEQTVGEAVSRLHISSACRKNQSLSISYQQYDYRVDLDDKGEATAEIFLVAPEAEATLTFADGEKAKHLLSTRDLRHLDRVILSWRGEIQMDLHVLAFGAALNSNKDLWRKTTCDVNMTTTTKNSQNQNSTFHCFRGSGKDAMNLQVYTRKRLSNNRHRGIIDFRVDYSSRGDTPALPYCDNGTAASPNFFTRRIIEGRTERLKHYSWKAVTCGTTLAPKLRYLKGTINQISIR